MNNFRIGQKVVCVNDKWPPHLRRRAGLYPPLGPMPVEGTVYTVSAVYTHDEKWGVLIELFELPYVEDEYWYPGFFAKDFRPVVERKTDISVFHKMLQPKTEKVM